MKTNEISLADLAASVLVVPPLARNPDLTLNQTENMKLIVHIEGGGISTLLYGGNANFYHIPHSEYARTLEMLVQAAGDDTWVIPSAGPDYGRLMDQASILRDMQFPTVMVLPNGSPGTPAGTTTALRKFTDKYQQPIVLYIKQETYLPVEFVKQLVDDGIVFAVKYAVVRQNPAQDDYLRRLLSVVDKRRIISGLGELPAIVHLRDFGLESFTTGSGAIAPRASGALLEALKSGNQKKAETIHAAFVPLENCRNRVHPIRVLHEAVHLCGLARTGPLLPFLHNLDESERQEVVGPARQLLSYEQTFSA